MKLVGNSTRLYQFQSSSVLHKNDVQKSYRKLSGSRDTKHGFMRQIGAKRSKMGRLGTLETVRNITTKKSETTGQGKCRGMRAKEV